jgi:hypothetical protein
VDDALAAVRDLLPGVRLARADTIAERERATVQRLAAGFPDGIARSLIAKHYRAAGEGWVRESAALSVLPPAARGPRVVAAGAAPPILVTEDLGRGASVADRLLGRDPHVAADAVAQWAGAIATLHAATRGLRAEFRAALAERQGELPVAASRLSIDIEDAIRGLDRECGGLGVPAVSGAFDELRELASRLGGSGTAAITPADTCPDNNVQTPDGLVLIDYEGAEWRHIAWDVAYLYVPWPTCWCSWQIPDDVAHAAFAVYRRTAEPVFPEVGGDTFERDVEAAVVGWALLTTTWFIANALGSDPPLNPERPTPTRRAMILHRLDRAARSPELPALAELAGRLAAALRERWGDVPLAYARAFRGAQ